MWRVKKLLMSLPNKLRGRYKSVPALENLLKVEPNLDGINAKLKDEYHVAIAKYLYLS